MKIVLKKQFEKSLKNFSLKIQIKAEEMLFQFKKNPLDPTLKRHKLHGKLKGLESINVTGDIRIILNPITNEIVEIVDIGTHSNLY